MPFVETSFGRAHLCKMHIDLSSSPLTLRSLKHSGRDIEPPCCSQCSAKGPCPARPCTACHGPPCRNTAHHMPQQNKWLLEKQKFYRSPSTRPKRAKILVVMQRGHNIHRLSSRFWLVTSTLNVKTTTCTIMYSQLPFPSNWFLHFIPKQTLSTN